MPDWFLKPRDGDFHDAPTRIPTGDCEAWERGENCGHTDCPQCGREAAALLRCWAPRGVSGILSLAREVCRIVEFYGVRIPDDAVALHDLARAYDPSQLPDHEAYAWAEGICEALSGPDGVTVPYRTAAENAAHAAGLQLVRDWQAEQRGRRVATAARGDRQVGRDQRWLARVQRAEQATAADIRRASPVPGKPWICPDEFEPLSREGHARRLGIASAAGAVTSVAPSGHPWEAACVAVSSARGGLGFESRAQHRGLASPAPSSPPAHVGAKTR